MLYGPLIRNYRLRSVLDPIRMPLYDVFLHIHEFLRSFLLSFLIESLVVWVDKLEIYL